MTDLKLCPFCGHPAVFEPFKARKGYAATVKCCNCPADITTITYDTEEEAEKKAVLAWNRRANEDAPTTDVVEAKVYSELARVHAKTAWKKMKEEKNNE